MCMSTVLLLFCYIAIIQFTIPYSNTLYTITQQYLLTIDHGVITVTVAYKQSNLHEKYFDTIITEKMLI